MENGTVLQAPVVILGRDGRPRWTLTEDEEGRAQVRLHGMDGAPLLAAREGWTGEAELLVYHRGILAAGLHATPHDGGVVTAYAPDGEPYAALLGTGRGVEAGEVPVRRREAA
jgi:hypothetical protein